MTRDRRGTKTPGTRPEHRKDTEMTDPQEPEATEAEPAAESTEAEAAEATSEGDLTDDGDA